jgi:hypothetical protein
MIKKFMIITSVILALFVAGGLMLSNTYEIKRSITIKADVSKVHALIGDLNRWSEWDPWRAADKSMQVEIEQATGKGASQKWISEHGQGRLVITQNDPKHGIRYELMFSDQYKSDAGFEYTASENQTVLTWYMRGTISVPVVGGYVAYLSSQNSSMIDQGLANLKALAEK